MSEDSPRRHARGKQPASYRFEDVYAFLEDGDSVASGTQSPDAREDSSSESDVFMPNGQEEEQEDDLDDEEGVEDEDDEGEDEDEDDEFSDEYGTPSRTIARDASTLLVSPAQIAPAPATNRSRRKQNARKSSLAFPSKSRLSLRNADGDQLRTRGVADFSKIGGQEIRLRDLYGPESENLKPILASRDYWHTQETFPLRQPGALRRSFFESADVRDKEATSMRKWYVEGGRDALAKGQKTNELSVDEGRPYLATTGSDSLNVLWGAIDDPQLNSLKKVSCISLSDPWKSSKDRKGWLFNLGARIYDVQWAPNEEGSTQYLAVSVEQNSPNPQPKRMEDPKAPAFTATNPYPASAQIWSFEGADNGRLDTSRDPRLELVVCTNWGALKQFRWSPVQETDEKDLSDDDSIPLGILACIWSDGHVRILDISIPKRDPTAAISPVYLHYSQAAIDISFPECIPTCHHWLSGMTLAVGTSTGTIGIWTLSRPGTFTPSPQSPKPWFYQQLADTFILTISSGWPSQPHFLSISIADGFARLFDLRSPSADATNSIRGRTLCLSQVWHEQTQSFVMPDEYLMLKHNPIRRYYHNLYSMRLENTITRVAASPVHPCLLVGSVDGYVEACNPVPRIANYKIIPWQQKWFAHEWRRPVDQLVMQRQGDDIEMADPDANDNEKMTEDTLVQQQAELAPTNDDAVASNPQSSQVPQEVLSEPLVRFTEGYKGYQPGIQHSVASTKPTNPEIGKGITVFEEQSAITALAWNPNLKFGTWAVAGMGSGLLRVEDVAV